MKKSLAFISLVISNIMISFASSNGDIILQNTIQYVFSPIYQLVAGVAVVYFLYGVAKFIYDLNDPEKKAIGKSHLFWGLIGLFIVLSVGGILPGFNTILGGMFKY